MIRAPMPSRGELPPAIVMRASSASRRKRAIRATCASASRNSAAGSLVTARGEALQDPARAVEALDGDDEREAELRVVAGVEFAAAARTLRASTASIRRPPAPATSRRSARCGSSRGRRVPDARAAARAARASPAPATAATIAACSASTLGERSRRQRALRDPGRMLEHAAERGDERGRRQRVEFGQRHAAVPVPEPAPGRCGGRERVGRLPVARDVDAPREPDVGDGCGRSRRSAPAPARGRDGRRAGSGARSTASSARRGRRVAFGVQPVERVLEEGEELVAAVEALRRGEAHVVGVERVGHDQVRHRSARALDLGPVRQVVGIAVGVVDEPAVLDDQAPRVRGLSRPVYQPSGGRPISRAIMSVASAMCSRSVASSTCW